MVDEDYTPGVDDFLPPVKQQRSADWKKRIAEADDFMAQGALSEAQLAVRLLKIAEEARSVIDGGLTPDTLLLLIQNRVGYIKGNLVATSTIWKVLQAVGSLNECVVAPEPKLLKHAKC